jgi:hypothetical protein
MDVYRVLSRSYRRTFGGRRADEGRTKADDVVDVWWTKADEADEGRTFHGTVRPPLNIQNKSKKCHGGRGGRSYPPTCGFSP